MKINKSFLITLGCIVIIGFLSGVVGELWVNSFLLPDPYLSFKSYSDLSKKIDDLLAGQNSKKNLSAQDAMADHAIQKAKPAVVKIYRFKNLAANAFNSLMESDLLGQGAVITNDGWILTSSTVVKNDHALIFVATADHRLFKSEKIIIDSVTNLAFVKINASDLPVIEFSLKSELAENESVFIFGETASVASAAISNLNYSKLKNVTDFAHSSEIFYKYILLSAPIKLGFFGSPIITLDGRMIGIATDESGLILPIDCYVVLLKNVVKGQAWRRPYLGVKFYDLSEVINQETASKKGALILKSRGFSADSPAKGILLADDLILKVENDELSAKKNLPELLSAYQSGKTVKFLINRSGREQEVEVKL